MVKTFPCVQNGWMLGLHNLYIAEDINKKVKRQIRPCAPPTEHHAMKAYWGSGGTAQPIL